MTCRYVNKLEVGMNKTFWVRATKFAIKVVASPVVFLFLFFLYGINSAANIGAFVQRTIAEYVDEIIDFFGSIGGRRG